MKDTNSDKPSLVLREPHAELEPAACRDYCGNIREHDYGVFIGERTGKNAKDVRGAHFTAGNRAWGNSAGIEVLRGKNENMSDKLMTFVLAGAVFMALLKDLVEYLKK